MDLHGNSVNSSKSLKEAFVSNLVGSSMLEISALSAIVPSLFVLRQWACALFEERRSYTTILTMDFLCVILPILLFLTVLDQWVYVGALLLTLLLLVCIFCGRSSTFRSNEDPEYASDIRKSILSYRVSVVLVTCLCILAVDFKIFPRRYAKTETYGTSLMDLGVGSFIVMNSLVSRQARGVLTMKLKYRIQSVFPLLILGVCRLLSTRAVDYLVHVGEYGVHWNFFFTLAAVALLAAIFNIHPRQCGVYGLLVLFGYQVSLISGLGEYLQSNERSSNIINQNKEGIYSIFGYWGMYLLGVHLGYHLFFQESSSASKAFETARINAWKLTALLWFLTIALEKYVERISRRTCNLSYVIFVLAQNFQVLSILMVSKLLPGRRPLFLEQAFNQNLLGSFLLANILTGIVNLCTDTLAASPVLSFVILFGYAFILTFVTGFLYCLGIKLKFW